MGVGLRLSNRASEELGTGQKLAEFHQWLQANGLYVFTMNGFPYGNFHGERVKDRVHHPDWTTRERVTYTKRLFDQLAVLLPEGMNGGVSTSPVSYKYWHHGEEGRKEALKTGAEHMIEIAHHLHRIEQETGKYLHLDVEPEPDGLLENTHEVLDFFCAYLNDGGETGMLRHHITLCYDICHFSLAYEEPEYTFVAWERAGIKVGKIQVSAALKIVPQRDMDTVWKSLEPFNEPVYLHQVTEKKGDTVKTYNDLPQVLEAKQDFSELRAHFHVPIFLEGFGILQSTQDHIIKTLRYIKEHPVCDHLEVETYTWDVLPKGLKRDINTSIVRELHWLVQTMKGQ